MNSINFTIQLCNQNECTGCEACRAVCPVKAIEMKPSGKVLTEMPIIDHEKCIKCHACERVCPVLHPVEGFSASKALAVIAKDQAINSASTSGGMAAIIAKWYIQKGGVAYGVVSEGREIFHKRCIDYVEIEKLKGSKYVKSYLRDSYKEVKEDLKHDKDVVFFGTPCQISGLKNYLNKDYPNLLTVDLICHGTPSQKLFKNHIDSIAKSRELSHIVFREEGYHMRLYGTHSIIYDNNLWATPFKDAYYTAFYIACASFRESCYKCVYANSTRIGDITIGDFWGLSKDVKFSRIPTGISLVLPNTKKGNNLLQAVTDKIEIHIRPINEAINGNAQLRRPSKLSINARIFRKLFDLGFTLKKALYIAYLPLLPYYYLKGKLNK